MSILDELKNGYPENVVQRMDQYISKTNEHIDCIENCPGLSLEKKKDICDYIENMDAFFRYVRPLIEPIAYCTLDNVKLIRKDYFERFKELIEISRSQVESEIRISEEHQRRINYEREKLEIELNKMASNFRHPYQ
jgi:hypothetical protein